MPPKTLKITMTMLDGSHVKGITTFPYLGWFVSISMLGNFPEVMVWEASNERATAKLVNSVEDGINYIAQQTGSSNDDRVF